MAKVKYFENKTTGVIWDVSDAEHIERLEEDTNFEETDAPKTEKVKSTDAPKTEK